MSNTPVILRFPANAERAQPNEVRIQFADQSVYEQWREVPGVPDLMYLMAALQGGCRVGEIGADGWFQVFGVNNEPLAAAFRLTVEGRVQFGMSLPSLPADLFNAPSGQFARDDDGA